MNIPLYLVTGATGGHALGSLLVEDHHAGLFAGDQRPCAADHGTRPPVHRGVREQAPSGPCGVLVCQGIHHGLGWEAART